jgi:hypothetical protein
MKIIPASSLLFRVTNFTFDNPVEYKRPRFSQLTAIGTAVVVVTIFVSFFGLERSSEIGRLAAPPGYDDVAYLFTAQVLLHAAQHQPWLETLRQLIDQHAPLSTFLGVLGFLAVPQGWAGPYIANCLVLGAFLIGCAVLLRPLPTAAIIGAIAAIGAIPVASLSITEFRPDFAWGFLSGLAAAALLRRRLFQFSWKRLLLIGLLCGLALVSKPSTGPFTAVILATAFVGSVLLYVLAGDPPAIRTRLRAIARVATLIGLGAAIVAGPVCAIIWRDVYAYILLALVELHDENAASGNFLFQLLFYSTGPGGRTALGQALWVLLLFWAAALAYSAIYKGGLLPRLICYLAVILVAYAIPTHTDTKTLFLGGAFYGTLIASTCAIAGELWRIAAKPHRPTGIRTGAVALIFVAGIALLVRANALRHPVVLVWASPEIRTDRMEATEQIWSVLKDHVVSREKELAIPKIYNVMVLSPEPVSAGTLSLLAVTQDVPLRAYGTYYARAIDELVLQIENFDYAVVTNSIQHPLYGPRLGDVFMKVMDDRQDFKRITSYSRLVGGTVKVYERRP